MAARCLAAALVAFTILGAAASAGAEPTEPENLGQPISSYLVLDTVLGADTTGRQLLYGATYVVSTEGVYFFAVDPVTGKIEKLLHMADAWGPYHVGAAPDGKVYVAPLQQTGKADLWMYDPTTDQVKVVATAPEPYSAFLFGLTVAPWNKVYVGAYPSGKIYEYDPKTGALVDLGVVVPGNRYPKALIALPGQRLLIGSGAPAHLTVYDLRTGQKTEVLPPEYSQFSFAYNVARIDNNVFVNMVVPGSRVLRFDAVDMSFLGETPSVAGSWSTSILKINDRQHYIQGTNDTTGESGLWRHDLRTDSLALATSDVSWAGPRLWWADVGGERWVTSIGVLGDWGRWNPSTGQIVTRRLALPGAPTNITALGQGPDGKIYGGTYETNALFSYDPASGATAVLGPVAKNRSGEILSMASTAGKLFIGSYTHAVLTVYDPTRAWNPGTATDSNPRDLGTMGEQQYRPWDMVVGSDGRVWAATGAAYGFLGGSLTAIDPATYSMESWRYLAGDHNLFSLAAGDGEIYAGSTAHGDGIDASGDAQLLVFDQASETKVFSTVPVPGASAIYALATAPDGRVYGSANNGEWFTFDPAVRTVERLGSFPFGTILGLTEGPDGRIYGNTGGSVFRIDPATNAITKLADIGGGYYRAMTFDADGRLYWGSGPSLMRLMP